MSGTRQCKSSRLNARRRLTKHGSMKTTCKRCLANSWLPWNGLVQIICGIVTVMICSVIQNDLHQNVLKDWVRDPYIGPMLLVRALIPSRIYTITDANSGQPRLRYWSRASIVGICRFKSIINNMLWNRCCIRKFEQHSHQRDTAVGKERTLAKVT